MDEDGTTGGTHPNSSAWIAAIIEAVRLWVDQNDVGYIPNFFEEHVSRTFVALARHQDGEEIVSEGARLTGFVRAIGIGLRAEWNRSQDRKVLLVQRFSNMEDPAGDNALDFAADNELRSQLDRLIPKLEAKDSKVAVMLLAGKSKAQIARELGVSRAAVTKQIKKWKIHYPDFFKVFTMLR